MRSPLLRGRIAALPVKLRGGPEFVDALRLIWR